MFYGCFCDGVADAAGAAYDEDFSIEEFVGVFLLVRHPKGRLCFDSIILRGELLGEKILGDT